MKIEKHTIDAVINTLIEINKAHNHIILENTKMIDKLKIEITKNKKREYKQTPQYKKYAAEYNKKYWKLKKEKQALKKEEYLKAQEIIKNYEKKDN